MKILLLINMYPPHSDGGYALECKEIVDALRARGHRILILTSNRGLGRQRLVESEVWRVLEYCPDNRGNEPSSLAAADLARWYRREWIEHGYLQRAVESFQPDIIYVWATKGLSHSLAVALAHSGKPFLAHVSGYWLSDHNRAACHRRHYAFWGWGRPNGISGLLKAIARKALEIRIPVRYEPLVFDRAAFTSKGIRAEHGDFQVSRTPPTVIYPGVPIDAFAAMQAPDLRRPRKVLYVGRIHPSKDVATLVRACAKLQADARLSDLEVTICGWQHDKEYAALVDAAIASSPIPERMKIIEPVAFEQMPNIFVQHHVLVLPSLHEPFGRVAAEAMGGGLPVVVSDSTGISELLTQGETGMVFPTGDVDGLAETLERVMTESGLAGRLSARGREFAVRELSTSRMVRDIENFMQQGPEDDVCVAPVSEAQGQDM